MIYYELGHAYEKYGNMNAAYDYYCRADEEFENLDSQHSEIRLSILFNLARCHNLMRNYRSALRYAEKAEKLATEYNKHLYRLRIRYMKGNALIRLGDIKRARDLYLAALKEAQDNSFLLDVAIINNNVGKLFQEIGDYAQARAHYQRAQQIFELLNEELFMCDTLIHLSELCHLEGNYEKAVEYIRTVLGYCEKIGVNTYREKAGALLVLGRIKASQGYLQEYEQLLEEALLIYDRHHVINEAYEVAVELANSLYERKDARAVSYYRKAIELNKLGVDMRR
jgi:tetratricopeptide (TPR) repeat protein